LAYAALFCFVLCGTDVTTGRALFLLDLIVMLAIWPLMLRFGCWGNECFAASPDGLAALLYPSVNLVCLYAMGLYRREAVIDIRGALARVPLAVGLGAVATGCGMVLLAHVVGPPADRVRMFAGAILGFCAAGTLARTGFVVLRRVGTFRRRLVVVGAGATGRSIISFLGPQAVRQNYDITFVQDPAFGPVDPQLFDQYRDCIRHAKLADVPTIAREVDADEIIMAPDERRGMRLDSLLECKKSGFPVVQYLSFIEHETRRIDVARLEIAWLLYTPGFYFGMLDRTLKRTLDIVVSFLLLILFGPFLIAASLAIKFDDGGPVLYSQRRVTRHGRVFRIVKLRTMRIDAEAGGAVWAAERDPRITRVGLFLRQSRVDEMPQLWNVLRGEMSLVGPRPERPEFVGELVRHLPLYDERHMVKAGITGWAQINYPYGASIEDARAKLSYDLYYVKNFSILFDMLIILQTLRVVLWPSGAR
jgi:sugar transferase (PEP-CTERM system associated)